MHQPATTTSLTPARNRALSLQKLAQKATFISNILVLFLISASGCVYQFTNQHIELPTGVRSIAVEAIYDTSREPIPHEILWKSLQRAIAKDGHLRLAPQSEADAIVRAQLRQVTINQQGAPVERGPKEDPIIFGGGEPPVPSQFRQLPTASSYSSKEILFMLVTVEVWNLHSGELIMRRDYSGSRPFLSLRPYSKPGALTSLANNYLRHEEAVTTSVEVISDSISQQVIQGLLVL